MTPYEMEEQLKNLDARTMAIAEILPTLAIKQDLRDEVAKLATRDELRLSTEALQGDLRLTTEALQHEIETGFQEAKADLQELRGEMKVIGGDVRAIAKQLAVLSGRNRKK